MKFDSLLCSFSGMSSFALLDDGFLSFLLSIVASSSFAWRWISDSSIPRIDDNLEPDPGARGDVEKQREMRSTCWISSLWEQIGLLSRRFQRSPYLSTRFSFSLLSNLRPHLSRHSPSPTVWYGFDSDEHLSHIVSQRDPVLRFHRLTNMLLIMGRRKRGELDPVRLSPVTACSSTMHALVRRIHPCLGFEGALFGPRRWSAHAVGDRQGRPRSRSSPRWARSSGPDADRHHARAAFFAASCCLYCFTQLCCYSVRDRSCTNGVTSERKSVGGIATPNTIP